jgi:hypothetical protein
MVPLNAAESAQASIRDSYATFGNPRGRRRGLSGEATSQQHSSYAKRASLADTPLIVDELKHTNRHAKNSIFLELSVSEVYLCFPLNLS